MSKYLRQLRTSSSCASQEIMSNSLAEWSGKILNLNPNSQKRLVLTIAFPTITTSIQMSKKRF